jgi:hypothetical protein
MEGLRCCCDARLSPSHIHIHTYTYTHMHTNKPPPKQAREPSRDNTPPVLERSKQQVEGTASEVREEPVAECACATREMRSGDHTLELQRGVGNEGPLRVDFACRQARTRDTATSRRRSISPHEYHRLAISREFYSDAQASVSALQYTAALGMFGCSMQMAKP